MSDIPMQELWVGRDVDRLGEHLDRGISKVFFKVSTEDNYDGLLVVDTTGNDHLPHSKFSKQFPIPVAIYEKYVVSGFEPLNTNFSHFWIYIIV